MGIMTIEKPYAYKCGEQLSVYCWKTNIDPGVLELAALSHIPKRCAIFLFSILVQCMAGEDPTRHLFPSLARAVSLTDYQSTLRKETLKTCGKWQVSWHHMVLVDASGHLRGHFLWGLHLWGLKAFRWPRPSGEWRLAMEGTSALANTLSNSTRKNSWIMERKNVPISCSWQWPTCRHTETTPIRCLSIF